MNKFKLSVKLTLFLSITSIFCTSWVTPFCSTAVEMVYPTPTARFAHDMVYDEINHQAILFGGSAANDGSSDLSDTWTFNCTSNTWTNLNIITKPTSRSGHSMVYDSINLKVILFGGWTADTWIFDPQSKQWTEVTSIVHPVARRSAGMYFDPVNEKVVLFGGYLNNDSHAGDTWIFNPGNHSWKQVFPSSKPEARYGHSLVYDVINQQGLLFGGRVTALQSETWGYNYSSNLWKIFDPSQKPIARYWHDAVFDVTGESMVLFGGDDEGAGRARNDVWTFSLDSEQWTEEFPENQPIPRSNHAMVYDSLNQRTLLFGGLGNDYSDSYSDTWAYDSSTNNWTDLLKIDDSEISSTETGSTSGFELPLVIGVMVSMTLIKFWKKFRS
jgi:N-acetylneuraminic acid mutarotase